MTDFVPSPPLPMLPPVQHWIDSIARPWFQPQGGPAFDFARPAGEEALAPPRSVSWRIFKNPVSVLVGGIAAVILELAEPRVRTGVWELSTFRADPVRRIQRTGLAAMVTVYAARSVAEAMIAGVVHMHNRIRGHTPEGLAYHANDAELLSWVQATACFGFARAYDALVRPTGPEIRDRFYAEAAPASRLYGALQTPLSETGMQNLFAAMRERVEPSPIIFEFLAIMRDAPVLPPALRPVQRMLVRAAVEIVPAWLRQKLRLTTEHGLRPWEKPLVRQMGHLADRVIIRSGPAVQSCLRLGLPADFLYRA